MVGALEWLEHLKVIVRLSDLTAVVYIQDRVFQASVVGFFKFNNLKKSANTEHEYKQTLISVSITTPS